MTYCPMCGHACYRTPERPDWSCPYHGRVNLLQAKMEKQAEQEPGDFVYDMDNKVDENERGSTSWVGWKSRFETVDKMYQTKVQELTDLQKVCRQFVEGIDKLGIS